MLNTQVQHKCSTTKEAQERACWHGIGLRARRHSGAQAAHRIRPVVKLCASDHVWQYIGGNVHQHACCAPLPCREARLPRWQLQRSLWRESHLYPRAVSRCACSASSPRYEALRFYQAAAAASLMCTNKLVVHCSHAGRRGYRGIGPRATSIRARCSSAQAAHRTRIEALRFAPPQRRYVHQQAC